MTDSLHPRSAETRAQEKQQQEPDAVCEHGTAMDVRASKEGQRVLWRPIE